jgi:hypothetical protein
LVDTFPRFLFISFVNWQCLPSSFSEEFLANQRNVSTNRKRGIALAVFERVWQSQKGLVLSDQEFS